MSHKTQALLDKAKELLKEKGIDEKPQQPLKRLERKRKQSTTSAVGTGPSPTWLSSNV